MKKIVLAGLLIGAFLVSGCSSTITEIIPTNNQSKNVIEIISVEEAKNLAIDNSGVNKSDVEKMSASLEEKNGREYYKVSFSSSDSVFSYEIDGLTGSILDGKSESSEPKLIPDNEIQYKNNITQKDTEGSEAENIHNSLKKVDKMSIEGATITEEQAKAMVLERIPGAKESDFRKFEIDYDNGHMEYEGEVIYNDTEYEFEIDAYSGAFRDWSAESVWD